MAEFNILDHLDKLVPDGGGNQSNGDHSFHCPSCESNNFKVNVKTGKWNTFGCNCGSTENGKRKIREALSPAKAQGTVATKKQPRTKKHYGWPYFDAKGEFLFTVHRWDDPNGKEKDGYKNGKKIRQSFSPPDNDNELRQEYSRSDGKKPKDFKLMAAPYGLADVDPEFHDIIYWVEGEKCVDALQSLGLPAITSLGGCQGFIPERDGPSATGIPPEKVCVVPDRDKHGLGYAEAVAAAYPGCRWLYPFPGTPEWNGSCPENHGVDVADWIALGATVEHIRNGTKSRPTTGGAPSTDNTELSEWELQVQRINDIPDPVKRTAKAWDLIRERAAEVVLSGAKFVHQQSAIKALGKEFRLNFDKRDIDAVLSDVIRETTTKVEPVMGGGRLTVVAKRWILQDLMLHGFNLLNGMPSAGKSRFLMAFAQAWLTGQDTFIGHQLYSQPNTRVLVLGTDQDIQEWVDVMAPLGLVTSVAVDNDIAEYSLHPGMDLYPLGCGLKLDRDGLQLISRWTASNPGGLILADSVSALIPAGVSESDDSLGRWARDIDEARRGAPLVLTHHVTKEAAFSGNTGVYAGRGSGSLDGAVSRVLGLSYLLKREGGKEVLDKTSPFRKLVSEKRGATNQDVVIEMLTTGWGYVGTSAEQRQRQAEEQGKALQDRPQTRFKKWKKAAWEATTDTWLSTAQIIDRLDRDLAKGANVSTQIHRALTDIYEKTNLLERFKPGGSQFQWKRRPEQDQPAQDEQDPFEPEQTEFVPPT